MDAIERIQYKGHSIGIHSDEDPENPREWDNLGTMICSHRRYNLGDQNITPAKAADFGSWAAVEKWLQSYEVGAKIIAPLFLYDHSGLRIKIGSFSGLLPQGHAEVDSGQVGFIYVTGDRLRKEYSVPAGKRIPKAVITKAGKVLQAEVETYDDYLSGSVYGFTITGPDGEDLDSLWGIYGYDYAISEAKAVVDSVVKGR